MSQEKEAQIKLYKTREDKELEKVIALENKVKVLDDIVYKTGQSIQTMNMLNRNCKTSFAKPEFLKKAQRANPRLYDIGCYNDNLALMLAPESDETIRFKFLGTVKFGNDQIAPILGYGDLVQGTITIKQVYYFEGLNHNLFSVGQFCDADLEVAFRKSTCYIRDLKVNDLLTGSRGTNLYSITLQDTSTPNPICLMAKATSSQAWLWHLRIVQTDKGIEFLNKTLHAYFAKEGIRHETSTARTPEQNGVIERRNRTLVEAARTMLSADKVPLFFWAEAIATACFTQNRSLIIPRHEKTPYHIINGWKPSVKFFHIFGFLCYIVRDGENLDKMKEKGDACIFVGYSTQSRAYRVFNKRTRIIVETIHVNFEELPQMASDHVSFDPVPQCLTTVLEQDSLSPDPESQENVPQAAETVTTSNELDLLFSPMFDELLNGSTQVVTKSSDVHVADAPDKRQHHNTTHSSTTTVVANAPLLNIQTTP
ncbi:integrase, catalytic region, zinc finger, CCHC-type containing protein [Tanacetum coccineum]